MGQLVAKLHALGCQKIDIAWDNPDAGPLVTAASPSLEMLKPFEEKADSIEESLLRIILRKIP